MTLPKPYYDSKGITIYHGDCRDAGPLLAAHATAFVTDPPYGVSGGKGGNERERGKAKYEIESAAWADTEAYIRDSVVPLVRQLVASGLRGAITTGNRCLFLYDRPADIGCFWSPADTGFGPWGVCCFHAILYYGKDPRAGKGQQPTGRYLQGNAPKNGHPCPKPEREWQWLVNKVCVEGDTVLDPFMGSGTTLRAAKDLGLKAIGIEIEEKYCEIAARRLEQEVFDFGEASQ